MLAAGRSHIYRTLAVQSSLHARSSPLSTTPLAQRQLRMTSVGDFVEDKIAKHKIVVFSKTYCPYCCQTKSYFSSGYPQEAVEVVELDVRDDGGAIQDYLKQKTGARSVPRTFISGVSVGGNDDLHSKPKVEVDALIAKRV